MAVLSFEGFEEVDAESAVEVCVPDDFSFSVCGFPEELLQLIKKSASENTSRRFLIK